MMGIDSQRPSITKLNLKLWHFKFKSNKFMGKQSKLYNSGKQKTRSTMNWINSWKGYFCYKTLMKLCKSVRKNWQKLIVKKEKNSQRCNSKCKKLLRLNSKMRLKALLQNYRIKWQIDQVFKNRWSIWRKFCAQRKNLRIEPL